ncbi:MAG: hypothetical protein U9N86_08845 [Bacteroidota bacterium]|nr:hypothetical protein [Bacteroidota bacterium]
MSEYLKHRKFMLTGDMLEFSSNSLIGKLIRWKTGKDVNHTSLILRLNEFKDLKTRVFTLESLGSGIELHLLSNRIKDFDGSVYWYALKEKYDKYRGQISSWGLKQIDVKYDYSSVFANLFGKISMDGRLYFCSEYVQSAYQRYGLIEDRKACRPGEFGDYNLHYERVQIK